MEKADESDIAVIIVHLTRVAMRHGASLEKAYDIADAVFAMAGDPGDIAKRRVIDAAAPMYFAMESPQ